MKRPLDADEDPAVDTEKKKKRKGDLEEEESQETGFVHLDEDLLFEVLKHVDARSLATASCVNKQWYKTAQDERLWEMICTRHWANTGCGTQQLRSVVLALGGFRRLHSHCLWPLLKPPSLPSPSPLPSSSASSSSSPSSSSTSSFPPALPSPVLPSKSPIHWGKDEVQLSLSLLSIRYFEKMNVNNRGSR
ncbi:F-box protein GID2-like [Macadamia integrifolia]|uniref:F-box protein GID2-like n=1 Tax=Macadamia integrifolia TaxID=60698 RepID=UPI001C4EBC0D|nr:F-box protein GID2-like [Macadamia integrifolia]